MPDRCPVSFTRMLLGLALLLPLATVAQPENWYQVEVLIFSYPAGGSAEQWEPTPELAYPQASRFLATAGKPSATALQGAPGIMPTTSAPLTPFATLPASQREFGSKAAAMQGNGRYRILFHEAWLQPLTSQSGTLPIVVDHSGDGGQWPQLQGTITLYLSSDLYLETNLWLNTPGEYLPGSWRMPPPPLGPPSGVSEGSMQAAQESQDSAARVVPQGPDYPYRHAVLLQETRRMRSGEVVYIDHPLLGVVVKMTALSAAAPETTAPPESTAQPGTAVAPQPAPQANPSVTPSAAPST